MQSSNRITTEEIRVLADAENEAYNELELFNDEGTPVAPDGRYWRPLEDWLRGYDPRTMPIATNAMRALAEAYSEFNLTGNAVPPMSLWSVRDEARRKCFLDPPEPIARLTPVEMHAAKLPLRLIANEWRWHVGEGDFRLPDIERVQRELDHPGSELTPEVIAARQRFDMEQFGFVMPEEEAQAEWVAEKVESRLEPLESLIFQRATIEQIANSKAAEYPAPEGYEEREWNHEWTVLVSRLAFLMGVHDIAVNARTLENEAGRELVIAQFGQAAADAELPTHPVMPEYEGPIVGWQPDIVPADLTPEERVLELFGQGQDAVAIARDVRMNTRKVKKIIADAAKAQPAK